MRSICAALVLFGLTASAGAENFRFLYQPGDQFRYYGTSSQKISINGQFYQNDQLSYRIAFTVKEAAPDGSGHLTGHVTYITQKAGAGAVSQEYDADYWVDAAGVYRIPDNQVMPVVRHVPTFPDRDLKPGDTWTAKGEEVHDMRDDYGLNQLLRVGFDVLYTYIGPVVRDGKTLHQISSVYTLSKRTGYRYPNLKLYPVVFTGSSTQNHYFNLEKGREEGYDEEYSLAVVLNTGDMEEFSGTGESHLVEAKTMDKPALVDEVKKGLEDRGLGNIEVKAAPRGVTLNLDNIRFPGESADLVFSEREKLRLIGEVLRKYPDRDILVEGHTADVASASDPQVLSEARAAAVGNYLVATGVRSSDQIVYKGWGSTRPLVPNDTEAHRAQNRRVEITLLEN